MDEEPQPSTSTGLNVRSKRIRKPNQKYRDDYISDISEELPRKINKNCETPPEIGSILRKGIKFTDSEEWLEFMKDDSNNVSVEEAAVQTELENDDEEQSDLDFNLSDLEDENSDNELESNNETIFEEPDDSYEPMPAQNIPVPNPQVPLIIQTGFRD